MMKKLIIIFSGLLFVSSLFAPSITWTDITSQFTLPEGITQDLVVTDNIPSGTKPTGSLPYGLKYLSSEVLSDDASLTLPFSGPTGVACANLGKAFTGIERERKYFDIACERIARAQAQERLFA